MQWANFLPLQVIAFHYILGYPFWNSGWAVHIQRDSSAGHQVVEYHLWSDISNKAKNTHLIGVFFTKVILQLPLCMDFLSALMTRKVRYLATDMLRRTECVNAPNKFQQKMFLIHCIHKHCRHLGRFYVSTSHQVKSFGDAVLTYSKRMIKPEPGKPHLKWLFPQSLGGGYLVQWEPGWLFENIHSGEFPGKYALVTVICDWSHYVSFIIVLTAPISQI